jgi:hypothetical protein
MTRLFFATDVHGSERCFRKFINAGKHYGVSVLILGGDITGKLIVPLVEQADKTYRCGFGGAELTIASSDLENKLKTIRDSGYYPYICSKSQHDELAASPQLVEKLFSQLMVEGIARWVELAEERLRGTNIRCYISPGNDDSFAIDQILNSSKYVINPEEKVVLIDSEHEMITLGYANHTPWGSPREVDEDVLEQKITKMAQDLSDPSKAIFNLHVPPIETPIDKAPKLDKDLKPQVVGGETVMISAGSVAVRKAIEKYQPLVGLHGHIHESKGVVKIGKTVCLNPGSEYGEGVLRGIVCDLEGSKLRSYLLTTG